MRTAILVLASGLAATLIAALPVSGQGPQPGVPAQRTPEFRGALLQDSARTPVLIDDRVGCLRFLGQKYAAEFRREGMTFSVPLRLEGLRRPELSYALEDLKMGGRLLARGDPVDPVVKDDEKVVLYKRGDDVEERYLLKGDFVEQTFVIRSLPEGRGPIRVTGRTAGPLTPPAEGTVAPKLSFKHREKDVIHVSDALAVDAAGRRQPLSLEYSGGKVSMTVPASWVAQATLPIEIDPVVGGPFEIDPSLNQVAGSRQVDVAYNATSNEWFVVWTEETVPLGTYNVLGQRISATGTLVGGQISIASPFNQQADVTVSWAPSVNRYLVAWGWLEGRIVNGDGTFFNDVFSIDNRSTSGSVYGNHPTAAFDGTNWYVCYSVWDGVGTRDNIRGRFVSTEGVPGTIADPDTEAEDATHAAVAFSNGTYLIAWDKTVSGSVQWKVAARTMNTSGTFLTGPTLVGFSANPPMTDCSAGDGRFLITWFNDGGPEWEIRGYRTDASLATLGAAFLIDSSAGTPPLQPRSAFSATASEWFITYIKADDVYGRRYAWDGTLPAGVERLTTTAAEAFMPELAWNSTTNEMLIAYTGGTFFPQLWGLRYAMPAAPPPPPPPTSTSIVVLTDANGIAVSDLVRLPAAPGTSTIRSEVLGTAIGPERFTVTALTSPPARSIPAPAILSPATGTITRNGNLAVSGTSLESGLTLTLFASGVPIDSFQTGAGGAWATSVPLSDAVYSLTARVSDTSGNTSPTSPPIAVTIDTLGPLFANLTPDGSSPVIGSKPTLSGTWADATTGLVPQTARAFLDGQAVGFAALREGGFILAYGTLGPGLHTVFVEVADLAGNIGSVSWTFTTQPAPAEPPPAPSITTPDGKKTNDNTPRIAGTASPGVQVKVYFNLGLEGVVTADGVGNWEFHDPARVKDDGVYFVSAVASNGLDSPSSPTIRLEVDTRANAPSNVRTTAKPGAIDVEWDPSPDGDIVGYRIYRSAGGSSGPFLLLNQTQLVSGTKFRDTGVTVGLVYCYKVTAVDNAVNERH
jgi:hypothetical protein